MRGPYTQTSQPCSRQATRPRQRPRVLHRDHKTSILIPVQQRILPAPRRRVLDVRPAIHEGLVVEHAGELARDGAVHVLHDLEVCGEEDVEVALLDLWGVWLLVFLPRGCDGGGLGRGKGGNSVPRE